MKKVLEEVVARVKRDKALCWYLSMGGKYIAALMILFLCGLVGARVGFHRAMLLYDAQLEQYKREQELAANEAVEADPYTAQLSSEAEMLARVLYGVKDNSSDDMRTYCWCVFNRVDNPAFPDTLEDVIAQPSQWMRYDQTNPVIEDLYQIALEELDAWHTNTRRIVSNEYVFMSWSKDDICLRDNFYEGRGTHYWRHAR